MLLILSTLKPVSFFLHWFADTTVMKNTLICSNKRKECQLCEILGHNGSEKWTSWGQQGFAANGAFGHGQYYISSIYISYKQSICLPVHVQIPNMGHRLYEVTVVKLKMPFHRHVTMYTLYTLIFLYSVCLEGCISTYSCTFSVHIAVHLPWAQMCSAAFRRETQQENRMGFHTFCKDIR